MQNSLEGGYFFTGALSNNDVSIREQGKRKSIKLGEGAYLSSCRLAVSRNGGFFQNHVLTAFGKVGIDAGDGQRDGSFPCEAL